MTSLEQLLGVLGRLGVAQTKDLVRELGVSQPTVSRLLEAAGERVCRMGQGRTTRYARTRALPGLGTRLPLFRVQETGGIERAGELHLLAGGRHWLKAPDSIGTLFEGLPPFAVDMSPQGYLGRTFSTLHPELGLPLRTPDWTDDHCLIALARRGEDCVGNLILGEESLNRWLASSVEAVMRSSYVELAQRSAQGQPGSSAGGEHPKFLTYSEGRHVLVKFAGGEGAADQRWRDLLVCESLALEEVRAAGLDTATARWFDEQGSRFLETERFDRIGLRGRRAVVSLYALDNEYFGSGGSWTQLALKLLGAGRLTEEDARRIRWLDVFGQLIGNTDRHLGNLSFLEAEEGQLRLSPVYDMLPMVFAPSGTMLVERTFEPGPPIAETLDVWVDAARHAQHYWKRLLDCSALSDAFRQRAGRSLDTLEALLRRVPL